MSRTVVAGALGNCVHVAGVVSFLRIAEQLGYETVFLGAAAPVERFVEAIELYDPDVVGVSYRLTADVGERLAEELKSRLKAKGLDQRRFAFGGTPPVCEAVGKLDFFERCFTGLENPDAVWAYLRGEAARSAGSTQDYGDMLVERLDHKAPYPLLRHHFGPTTVDQAVGGVRRIAESGVLDVISLAPDQNAQESFFRPHEMDSALDGAGGVPLRIPEDLTRIYEASRCGNRPLLRIYSGTRDLLDWAELASSCIHNAWAAVPLCWYSALDGRSQRSPAEAIAENQRAIRWHAERRIPVEINEPHHWALRDAHDTLAVVMAYLSAYNARALGVQLYLAQYMLNTPAGISAAADLAKTLAQIEMVESLHGPEFMSVRQLRAGLLSFSPRLSQAKGQLAASTVLALAVRPHIIHVVGYCEGDHAATADDVVESCEIVHGVLRNWFSGTPDMTQARVVQQRKEQLLAEAEATIGAIRELADTDEDPFTSPRVLARAIATGILDAPHLKGNPCAAGRLVTRLTDTGVHAIDPVSGRILTEHERLAALDSSSRPHAAEAATGGELCQL